jgi:hypothetical protein
MAWRPSLHQQAASRSRWLHCGRAGWLIAGLSAGLWPSGWHATAEPTPPSAIPPHNRADQSVPPPRPAACEVTGKIRKVFDAVVHDDPALAAESFFPRPAFLLVKDIKDPGAYYDQLRRRFDSDIHSLHKRLPGIERAEFERFELAQRGGFVPPQGEGNRLPYWAARHSVLHFRVDGQPRQFEVRVLITWDDHWYVIHLNEFH